MTAAAGDPSLWRDVLDAAYGHHDAAYGHHDADPEDWSPAEGRDVLLAVLTELRYPPEGRAPVTDEQLRAALDRALRST